MPQIKLEPLGLNLQVAEAEGLLRAFQRAKVDLDAACGGQGTCGTCAIKILKAGTALSPMQIQELTTLQNARKDPQHYRLSCQTYAIDDGVVFQLNHKAARKLVQIFERLKNRRAPRNIVHPGTGEILVERDGIITQEILERLLSV